MLHLYMHKIGAIQAGPRPALSDRCPVVYDASLTRERW